ncbi:hypothetical protein NLU66_16645 [Brachybacterium sp. NBEC-018]|uniref:hypothetical protein n=1 Tax=Brachybacterium sp. NBEC-018 TaxID=2996004 RepID=UPI0021751E84|nr:hypothetical protein [Brachybacterium sp. NBEC-018]UVY83817.1 hypothetical protein NLU66_16645 [Brachybacterium sp. NBEC-018]
MPDQKITVTDEMVLAYLNEYYEQVDRAKPAPTLNHFTELRATVVRNALTAALDAAPTTNPAHDIDWQEVAERHEDTIKALVAERDEAEHELRVSEKLRRDIDPGPVLDEVARLDGALHEMRTRAEKAEKERDAARADLAGVQGSLDAWLNATPRELLDATWQAAYVPEDGIIPARTTYLYRHSNGDIRVFPGTYSADPADQVRRLLDPPTPKRPDGAEEIEALIREANREGDGTAGKLADRLASRGVRVTEDGAS